jgi:hypothetical protein
MLASRVSALACLLIFYRCDRQKTIDATHDTYLAGRLLARDT